jgi:predicted DNA-binding WGR domain protein
MPKRAASDVEVADTTRLTNTEGSSSKFWEISIDGSTTTVTYGKTGKQGASTSKEHATEEAARKFASKEIAAKLRKYPRRQ